MNTPNTTAANAPGENPHPSITVGSVVKAREGGGTFTARVIEHTVERPGNCRLDIYRVQDETGSVFRLPSWRISPTGGAA